MNDNNLNAPKVPRSWHEMYIESQADPMDSQTDKQFCDSIQLDYSTFANWKNKYRKYIFSEVDSRRKNYVNELRAKGHKALTKKLDKDTNAIKLLFQLLGDLVEKTEVRTELSNEDKIRRIQTLRDSVNKRTKAWETAEAVKPDSTPESEGSVGPKAP